MFLHIGNDTKVDNLINFEKMRMFAKEVRTINQMGLEFLMTDADGNLKSPTPSLEAAYKDIVQDTDYFTSTLGRHSKWKSAALSSDVAQAYGQKSESLTQQNETGGLIVSQNRQKMQAYYEESIMMRRVKQYQTYVDNNLIIDEDKLMTLSKELEPPQTPASEQMKRKMKSNLDTISVTSTQSGQSGDVSMYINKQPAHTRQDSAPLNLSMKNMSLTSNSSGNLEKGKYTYKNFFKKNQNMGTNSQKDSNFKFTTLPKNYVHKITSESGLESTLSHKTHTKAQLKGSSKIDLFGLFSTSSQSKSKHSYSKSESRDDLKVDYQDRRRNKSSDHIQKTRRRGLKKSSSSYQSSESSSYMYGKEGSSASDAFSYVDKDGNTQVLGMEEITNYDSSTFPRRRRAKDKKKRDKNYYGYSYIKSPARSKKSSRTRLELLSEESTGIPVLVKSETEMSPDLVFDQVPSSKGHRRSKSHTVSPSSIQSLTQQMDDMNRKLNQDLIVNSLKIPNITTSDSFKRAVNNRPLFESFTTSHEMSNLQDSTAMEAEVVSIFSELDSKLDEELENYENESETGSGSGLIRI